MHLKNFSVITRDKKTELSPAYDLLNSTIIIGSAEEELALQLAGKKRKFQRKNFLDYFAKEKLGLSQKSITKEIENFLAKRAAFEGLIDISFLNTQMKEQYYNLMCERYRRLFG